MEKIRLRKKTTHASSFADHHTHKCTQTNRCVVILLTRQSGTKLHSVVLNSSLICHTHTIWTCLHTHLFGQGRTSGIVSQGKQGGDNGSANPLSDCSHTKIHTDTSMCAHARFRQPFSSAVVYDSTTHRLKSWCCKA